MIGRIAIGVGIAVAMIAVAVMTVIDHLIIGGLVFVAMIVMVATAPRSRDGEESDMARARRNWRQPQDASRDGGD